MAKRDIIAIGGSAGSIGVIRQICAALPADLQAAILVAVHIAGSSQNLLAGILDSGSPLLASTAVDGEPLQSGRIYVAPGDRHLVIEGRTISLGRGPRENMARPAIDPLFRSAGLSAGPSAIGVLLSGMLNDGSSGLADLRRCGGVTVVQNPLDAAESEMPRTALLASDVDYRAPANELADLLIRLVDEAPGPAPAIPVSIALEVAFALGRPSDGAILSEISDPVSMTCPGCVGALSQITRSPPPLPLSGRPWLHGGSLGVRAGGRGRRGPAHGHPRHRERAVLMEKMTLDAMQAGRTAAAATCVERAREYRQSASVLMEAALKA